MNNVNYLSLFFILSTIKNVVYWDLKPADVLVYLILCSVYTYKEIHIKHKEKLQVNNTEDVIKDFEQKYEEEFKTIKNNIDSLKVRDMIKDSHQKWTVKK